MQGKKVLLAAADTFRAAAAEQLTIWSERSGVDIVKHEEGSDPAAVVFDGCVVHGAGPNSTSERRRALHLFFAKPWVQPHWDFPAMFAHRESELTDDQRQLLGFNSRPRRFNIKERIIES